MLKRIDTWLWLLIAIVSSRLLTMAVIPMMDTTEARYAEIARIMAETNDWITPWFDYDVPFWGKPPLSFWLQALSFQIFGVTEFAARLPSWLVNVATLALIYKLTLTLASQRQALIATLIYATMALSHVMSGAVLTDPFLALGTTLALTSIILSLKQPGSIWRWGFFLGISIGLLAKGPLALVLIGGPLGMWLLWRRQWHCLHSLPWVRGTLLTIIATLPWYIAAELKSPGFINYFIIGEHFLRFVDSGWQGDLYGSAHKQAYGTIWLYWIWASLPWGPLALLFLGWRWLNGNKINPLTKYSPSDAVCLLLLAAIFPSLFFTFSGNILWTYQLPGLAPLAIIIAMLPIPTIARSRFTSINAKITLAFMPALLLSVGVYTYIQPNKINTEKQLVSYYDAQLERTQSPLIYLDKAPFSARFYSRGKLTQMTLDEFKAYVNRTPATTYFLSVANNQVDNIRAELLLKSKIKLKNKRFTLLEVIPLVNTT